MITRIAIIAGMGDFFLRLGAGRRAPLCGGRLTSLPLPWDGRDAGLAAEELRLAGLELPCGGRDAGLALVERWEEVLYPAPEGLCALVRGLSS